MRVDRHGQPVCGLRLSFSNAFGDDRLVMAFQWPRIIGDGFNGTVTAGWDADVGRPGLQSTDLGAATNPSMVTADELFHRLWGKFIDHVENAR